MHSAQKRFHTSIEFRHLKRLGQVIIGTSIEPRHFVIDLFLASEEQYGCGSGPGTVTLADLHSRHSRKIPIKDGQVEKVGENLGIALLPIQARLDLILLGKEILYQHIK